MSENVDKVLDIVKDVCPYTFVKSKLALEELESGQFLEVHLGNSESAANVPRSMELEGHEVQSVELVEPNHWVLLVKRA